MTPIDDLTAVLAPLSKRDAAELCRRAEAVTVPAGTTIVPRDSLARWAYIVLEGDALEWGADGMRIIRPGQIFPTQVLTHDRSAVDVDVSAITNVTALIMGVRELWGAVDELPSFAAAVNRAAPSPGEPPAPCRPWAPPGV